MAAGAGVLEKEVQELLKQYAKFAQVGILNLENSSHPWSHASGGEKDGRHQGTFQGRQHEPTGTFLGCF